MVFEMWILSGCERVCRSNILTNHDMVIYLSRKSDGVNSKIFALTRRPHTAAAPAPVAAGGAFRGGNPGNPRHGAVAHFRAPVAAPAGRPRERPAGGEEHLLRP